MTAMQDIVDELELLRKQKQEWEEERKILQAAIRETSVDADELAKVEAQKEYSLVKLQETEKNLATVNSLYNASVADRVRLKGELDTAEKGLSATIDVYTQAVDQRIALYNQLCEAEERAGLAEAEIAKVVAHIDSTCGGPWPGMSHVDSLIQYHINQRERLEEYMAKPVTPNKLPCIFCGRDYTSFGHNAAPVTSGRCCDECNATKVIPARLKLARTVGPVKA